MRVRVCTRVCVCMCVCACGSVCLFTYFGGANHVGIDVHPYESMWQRDVVPLGGKGRGLYVPEPPSACAWKLPTNELQQAAASTDWRSTSTADAPALYPPAQVLFSNIGGTATSESPLIPSGVHVLLRELQESPWRGC